MPKVTHNNKSNLELRRGSEDSSSDPYLHKKKFPEKYIKGLKTLDFNILKLRRSRTSNNDNFIKHNKYTRTIGLSSSIVLLLILSLTFIPVVSNKQDKADAASGTASSTEINITDGKATVNLTTTSVEGTFATSSSTEMAEFGVKTTNYTGYTLTIVADDDDKTLVNSDSSITTHNTFSSITTVIDEKTFDTSTYNGMWGYKPSKMNSTDNVGFWPSPTTKATTLDVTKEANPTTDNNYTIALGARAGYAQAAGTYSKTMTLTATANPVNYSVTYTDNTGPSGTVGTDVVNLPDPTTSSTTGTTATLSTVRPSRTGYVFNKWCDTAPTSSGTVCTGNTYDVGDSFPINQTTSNVITLYATWTIPTYDITIKPTTGISSVSLNGTSCASTSGCTVSSLTYGQSYTLSAIVADGYTFAGWSNSGAGEVASLTSASTTYKVGEDDSAITALVSGSAAQSVKINFSYAGGGTTGISSVTFKETATGNTAGTISTSGGSVLLNPGTGYTITTTSATDYGVKSYTLNNASYGSLYLNGNTDSSSMTTNYFTPNSSSSSAVITIGTCLKTISGTMQTYTTNITYLCDDATGSLTDSRDGQIYTVGKLITYGQGGPTNGTLWMTRNLAIGCNGSGASYSNDRKTGGVSLTSSNSNVSTTWNTSTAGALTEGDSLDAARMQCSSTYGAWYNYAAASAGTVTGSSITTSSGKDVCPSGWRLPNLQEAGDAARNKGMFNPVGGGRYYNRNPVSTANGYWWASELYGTTGGWNVRNMAGISMLTCWDPRSNGFYVRCVRK